MTLTDPRSIFGYTGYFDQDSAEDKVTSANLLDENGDAMTYKAFYAYQLLDLEDLFITKGIDIVFVIEQSDYPQVAFHQATYEVKIQPYAIDKHNPDGTVRVRATKALWQADQEVIRILRENPVGSYRQLKNAKPIVTIISPMILWGTQWAVTYTQIATAHGSYTAAPSSRRFHAYTKELRIGQNSGTYSSIGAASGLLDVEWEDEDPWVEIKIRGAADALHLPVNNPDVHGKIIVSDIGGLRALLTATDVSGVGTYAVNEAPTTSVARRIIGYMAVVESIAKVINVTDARSAVTNTYVFNGAFIRPVKHKAQMVSDPITIEFHADSCTETDS